MRDDRTRGSARGVRKRYRGGREVLAGIDLDVAPGRPVVVIGGNGTGKSTLLRIAAGCCAPTQGSVSGRPPVVGFLPAHFPASSRMPVRAYLRHMAAMHGAPAATSFELLDALGFSGAVDGPVAQLSTGNVQKVGIAQALGCGAGLLVLDEPWPGLDARAATALDDLLVDEIGRGTAMLIADHTGRAADLAGSTVLQMANGRLGPAQVEARRVAHTVVELRCPGEPAAALRALPPVRESWTSADSLTVRVPVDRGDSLLAAALAAGCSVLDVRREGHR